ncbi:MAG TPA: 6-bladed beta-propeller [Firmicutes bacterium]|nr:6-bladed beta-propeller [Bacillota bacterium]
MDTGLLRKVNALVLAVTIALTGATPAWAAKKKPAQDLVWPPPPEKARIKYLATLSSSDDVTSGFMVWLRRFVLGRNSAEVQLKLPYGVAVDSKGRLYVTDYGFGTVTVFDQQARKAYYLGRTGTTTLAGPVGIAIGQDDSIFVSDTKLAKVFKFTPDGRIVYVLGSKPGEFDSPSAVAVDRSRDILYVLDSQLHKILKYRASDGSPLGTLGERGRDPGQFNFPTNLWVDQKTGQLFVSDTMNFRVQMFDKDGKFIRAFGELGDGPGMMARSRGIALDTEGHVYVVDAAFNNFQIFDQKGQLLLWVGQAGREAGQFNSPAGIFIDGQNRIYVADRLNARVQVFQFLGGN